MYELQLEQFSGPIEKLLELIEEKKMEITRLSLAQITADFLSYLRTIEKLAPAILADFLVVASKLLLIKSKALLPNLALNQEEEREIKDLENRLLICKEFKAARNYFKNLWREEPVFFNREFLAASEFSFYPPKNIETEDLKKVFGELIKEVQKFVYETKEIKLETVNIEEKMQELLKKMEAMETMEFGRLADSQSKIEIIICFLGVLHLIKDQLINVQQKEHFSEIVIHRSK